MRKLLSLVAILLGGVVSLATISSCGSTPEPLVIPTAENTPRPEPTATPVPRTQQVRLTNPEVPPDDVLEQVTFVQAPTASPSPEGGAVPTKPPASGAEATQPAVKRFSNEVEIRGNGLYLSDFEPYRALRILVYQEDTYYSARYVTEWFATVDGEGQKELQISGGDPTEYRFFILDADSGRILFKHWRLEQPLK